MSKMNDLTILDDDQKIANTLSHKIGVVDECYACIYCEIKSWNAWKEFCRG